MKSEKDLFLANATKPLPEQHYLASPYTSSTALAQRQYTEASRQAGEALRRQGYVVYCPLLSGSHELSSGWYHYDLAHVRDSRGGLLILTLPGWEKSHGIQLEMAAALALGYSIQLISPTGLVDPELLASIRNGHAVPKTITIDEQGVSTVVDCNDDLVYTRAVASNFAAGNDIEDTADQLNLPPETVCDALRYHLQ